MEYNDELLIALLLSSGVTPDDPEITEYIYDQLRSSFSKSRSRNPVLERLLYKRLSERGRTKDYIRELANNSATETTRHFLDYIENRFERYSSRILKLEREVQAKSEQLELLQRTGRLFDRSSGEILWMAQQGFDLKETKTSRLIPIRIYISDPVPKQEELNNLTRSLIKLLESVGLDQAIEFEPESGSWWKRFFAKSKEALTSKQVTDRTKKAERAVELQYLDKPQAEANKAQASGAAQLITSLGDVDSAAIQAGSLLLVKTCTPDGKKHIVSRTLSPTEVSTLEANQHYLAEPTTVLKKLKESNSQA